MRMPNMDAIHYTFLKNPDKVIVFAIILGLRQSKGQRESLQNQLNLEKAVLANPISAQDMRKGVLELMELLNHI